MISKYLDKVWSEGQFGPFVTPKKRKIAKGAMRWLIPH